MTVGINVYGHMKKQICAMTHPILEVRLQESIPTVIGNSSYGHRNRIFNLKPTLPTGLRIDSYILACEDNLLL